jgi:hypothetical protein
MECLCCHTVKIYNLDHRRTQIGFAVLVSQIESRYANAHDTAMMARATDRFQLTARHTNGEFFPGP